MGREAAANSPENPLSPKPPLLRNGHAASRTPRPRRLKPSSSPLAKLTAPSKPCNAPEDVLVRGLVWPSHPENIPLERKESPQLRQPSSFQVQLKRQRRVDATSPN